MRLLLGTEAGRELYEKRDDKVVFGQIKFNRRIDASNDRAVPPHCRNGD